MVYSDIHVDMTTVSNQKKQWAKKCNLIMEPKVWLPSPQKPAQHCTLSWVS